MTWFFALLLGWQTVSVAPVMAVSAAPSAVQPAVQEQPPALTVRLGDRAKTVPTLLHPLGGRALRADLLAEALGGQLVLDRQAPWRYRFEVGTSGVDIEAGAAWAIVAGDTLPLGADVLRREAFIYVPWTFATDLLPRMGAGVLYDAAKSELRRFAPVVATRRTAPTTRRTDTPTEPPPTPASAASRDNSRVSEARLPGNRRHIVVVDAGHGGPDNGMAGPIGSARKVYEKNITLNVSKALRTALEERGVSVVMTRTTDTLIALSDRGKIANQAKGDLFVSIHVNAANPRWKSPGAARGFETYFLAEAKTEDAKRVEAMENESIRFETTADASRDDPLGFIIRDMAQNEHLRESSRLAELIQGGMKTVHPGPNRGVKQAGFRVLVTAFMPAVLVEIGFGSNPAESAWMNDPAKQRELTSQIADAVVRYLAEYEKKVGG
ncbi:MAG: N-acetylmuramoyl-L-alanine amidase [Gemmatimonadaceae bacterium]|nr:N-acetylmuramoyl-L-alanine amidase [Gemmatimonadaceae bacterium]